MKKRELYRVQQLHASLLAQSIERNNHALDGSSTGCGKTLVAAELAAQYRRPTLVVGLKSTLPVWTQEMKDRGWPAVGVINYEKLRTGKTPWGTWEGRKNWKWTVPKDTIIVWDEFQNCQGMNSLNAKMMLAAKPYTNVLLSATGAEDPTDMRASGYILGLHSIRDFWTWCKRNGCVPNQWGGLDYEGGNEVLNRIHNYIFPNHGSRLTLEDMKDHFTETQIITTPLEFGEEIEKIYAEMEKEIAQLEEIMTSDSDHPAAEALIAKLRARQRVEFLKVPTIIEMAGDLITEGRSVVVFVNFNESINAILKRFPEAKVIRGGQTTAERQDAIDSFQNNTCRFLICNVKAGGVSLSLHDLDGNHPRVAIISPDWNAKAILQTLGRIHRAGGQSATQQHVLFAAGTVEVQVEKSVRNKINLISIFNDGIETPCVTPLGDSLEKPKSKMAERLVIPVAAINLSATSMFATTDQTVVKPFVNPANEASISETEKHPRNNSTDGLCILPAPMESPMPNTSSYSKNKKECAQSVVDPNAPQTEAPCFGSPSITATKQRAFAGCSAATATQPSANSARTLLSSSAPSNIYAKPDKNVAILPRITENRVTVTEEINQPAHAEFNPSSLSMFEKCPGFRNRDGSNYAADAGTRIHKALETDNLASLDDEYEKACAQSCKDFIDALILERGVPDKDFREVRIYIDLGGGLTTFGTCDRLLVWGKKGTLIDFKSGRLAVADAEENAQGWSYVLGAFQRKDLELDACDIFFLIPNRDEISSATFTRSQMNDMRLRLNTIVRRAMASNESQYNPQPELCEYCDRQETCPALALKALAIAKKALPGLPVPDEMTVSVDRIEDIPKLLRLAPLMEAWASGIRKSALKLNLQEGVEIDGFRRIERSNPRSVNSVVGTWKVIRDKGITLEDFLTACGTVSVPQLEDLVASLAARGDKGKAIKTLENDLRAADVLNEGGKSYYLKEKKK